MNGARGVAMNNKSKLIVITGCGSGLGAELLVRFIGRGYQVLAVLRRRDDLDIEVQSYIGSQLHILELDLACENAGRKIASQVTSLLETGLYLDAVLFNAAVHYGSSVEDVNFARALDTMTVNFYSVLSATQCLIPVLKRQRSGKLLAISSLSAHIALANDAIYSASKAALERLFESLDVELAPFGIDVGLVVPGAFKSNLMGAAENQSDIASVALNEVVETVIDFVACNLDGFSVPGNQQAKEVLGSLSGKSPKERQQLARSWSGSQ